MTSAPLLVRLRSSWSRLRPRVGKARVPGLRTTAWRLAELPDAEQLLHRLRKLPPTFLEAFDRNQQASEGLLEGNRLALERGLECLERWRTGAPVSLALVGPRGVGSSSVLAALERTARERGLQSLRLTAASRATHAQALLRRLGQSLFPDGAPEGLDGLVSLLLHDEPRMLVLEDVHHLFLRVPGILECLHAFNELVLRTRTRCPWLLSAPEEAWQRLDALGGLGSIQSEVLACPAPDRSALRGELLARQARTGLPLHLRLGEEGELVTPSDPRHEAALGAICDHLHDLGRGSLKIALYYWLLALQPELVDGAVVIESLPEPALEPLADVPSRSQLVLAELHVHGSLRPEEVAAIFLLGAAESRVLLERLRGLGLAAPAGGAAYRISPRILPQVVRMLTRAHLLY